MTKTILVLLFILPAQTFAEAYTTDLSKSSILLWDFFFLRQHSPQQEVIAQAEIVVLIEHALVCWPQVTNVTAKRPTRFVIEPLGCRC
ncbi:MAG: hypothetical protein L3J82_06125 [Planctomycetes bacterium]|nr:hypothetical protein [Planctomycetota bacterium]